MKKGEDAGQEGLAVRPTGSALGQSARIETTSSQTSAKKQFYLESPDLSITVLDKYLGRL